MLPARLPDLAMFQEVAESLVSPDTIKAALGAGSTVVLNGRKKSILVGKGGMVKVNVNLGVSDPRRADIEREKVRTLCALGYRPDAMMDLSIVRPVIPLYQTMFEEFGGPIGSLPHYLCYKPTKGIDVVQLLEEIHAQAEAGIAWMTLHVTVRKDLYEDARRLRLTPMTARGGGILLDDMLINNRSEGVLSLHFDEILSILREYNVVLSIGAAFRPATVLDGLDEIHRKETELQGVFIREAQRQGVQVMMEGVGHMHLSRISEYVNLIKANYNIPFVPLGPIPTDAAVGEDHIASAIGAAYMALLGGADMLNSVTREEHTGRVPNNDSILEGLRAVRIAAHAVNICRFPRLERSEREISELRGNNYTCVVEGGLFSESSKMRFSMGCTRCGNECPLVVNWKADQVP